MYSSNILDYQNVVLDFQNKIFQLLTTGSHGLINLQVWPLLLHLFKMCIFLETGKSYKIIYKIKKEVICRNSYGK